VQLHPRRRKLDAAVGALEAHRHRLGKAQAVDPLDEIHEPVPAAEIAIGAALQADVLLQGDRTQNLCVLDLAQFGGGHGAGLLRCARIKQSLRSQQASDGVGAKRWRLILHSMIPDVAA
jgi:hypothetical protein